MDGIAKTNSKKPRSQLSNLCSHWQTMFGIVLKKLFLTLLNKKNTIKWMLRMHSLYLRVSYRKGQSDIHTAVGAFL